MTLSYLESFVSAMLQMCKRHLLGATRAREDRGGAHARMSDPCLRDIEGTRACCVLTQKACRSPRGQVGRPAVTPALLITPFTTRHAVTDATAKVESERLVGPARALKVRSGEWRSSSPNTCGGMVGISRTWCLCCSNGEEAKFDLKGCRGQGKHLAYAPPVQARVITNSSFAGGSVSAAASTQLRFARLRYLR
jgi:hypothetical protein